MWHILQEATTVNYQYKEEDMNYFFKQLHSK